MPGTHNRQTRMSDHRNKETSGVLNKLERGSRYWKLTVLRLEHQEYMKGINKIFNTIDNSLTPVQSGKLLRLRHVIFLMNFAKH